MNAISTLNATQAPSAQYAAQFFAATGWLWNDAVDMAIECAVEARDFSEAARLRGLKLPVVPVLLIDVQRGFKPDAGDELADGEIAKGWTFADAMDMASEIQRENRIFGRRHSGNRSRRNRGHRFSGSAFERTTGWTMSDAIDEAATLQRERRIFGNN